MRQADVVDDGETGDEIESIGCRDTASVASDDDAEGAGATNAIMAGGTRDVSAGCDPGIGRFEIENRRERRGRRDREIESDADNRTRCFRHTQSMAFSGESFPPIKNNRRDAGMNGGFHSSLPVFLKPAVGRSGKASAM
jgi:hypothetical protein